MSSTPERFEEQDDLDYELQDQLDFSVITMGMKNLPFFEDDTFLGMQAINVGIVDAVLTSQEYALLRRQFDEERTPADLAHTTSALSQMWILGIYEVVRMWRDRRYEFKKLCDAGGIDAKITHLQSNEEANATVLIRRDQLKKYRDETSYRDRIEKAWERLEPVYRMIELFRMNLAKHASPGKDAVIPRAPGYGRINRWCGSIDFELVDKEGHYHTINRRDIANALRAMLKEA